MSAQVLPAAQALSKRPFLVFGVLPLELTAEHRSPVSAGEEEPLKRGIGS